MSTRLAQSLALTGLALLLSGCGLFGVPGPGLDKPTPSSLDANCVGDPPSQLPASCPLAGIGADLPVFKDSHLFAGSTTVIPGTTNFLDIVTSMNRVTSFHEQFHASPPYTEREARLIADAEVPQDGKRVFLKQVGGACEVIEYKSKRLRAMYGKPFSGVLIVLRSADPNTLDAANVTSADVSLAAPHSAASFTTCP